MKYYFLELGIRVGDLEFEVPSVCALSDGESADEYLEERAKTFYSNFDGSEPYNTDGEWFFNGGEHCTYSNSLREITQAEFEVLKKFIHSYSE